MSRKSRKTRGRIRRVLCAVGTTVIVIVVLLCALPVLPKLFGYQMYHVLSGSMEPELPVGSLIYVQEVEPEKLEEGDIIAFYGSETDTGIITHRVVANQVVSGKLKTKGDANEQEDPLPVSYGNVIGRVRLSVPRLGKVMICMTSRQGKIALACVVLLGVILNITGSSRKSRTSREE